MLRLPSEWPHETCGGHSGKTDEKEHHERSNCFTQNVQVQSLRHLGAFHWLARSRNEARLFTKNSSEDATTSGFPLLDRSGASSGHGPRHCQCRWFISDFVAGWFVVVWSICTLIWLKNHPQLRFPLITMILSIHCVFLHFSESDTTVERPSRKSLLSSVSVCLTFLDLFSLLCANRHELLDDVFRARAP